MEDDQEDFSAGDKSFEDKSAPVAVADWIDINIKQSDKRTTTVLKITDTYVVYEITTALKENPTCPGVKPSLCEGWTEGNAARTWRRYSEFDLLRDYLVVTYPAEIIPPLPEKRISLTWQKIATDKLDPEYLERRRGCLETFLRRLSCRKAVSGDPILLGFLCKETDWKESVLETNFQSKAHSKIKALSAGYRITNKDERFEKLKAYCSKLEQHTANVLKTRSKAVDHLYGVYRIHANFGRILSEWCCFENDSLAESLQKAGHFIDAYSSSVEVLLEAEDDFSDQLKEYHGFGDALRSVCRKQELLVLEIQQMDAALKQKQTERQNVDMGKTGLLGGLKARVFGKVSEEEKKGKLSALDDQILELEESVSSKKGEFEKFMADAVTNVEEFQVQKVKDMKEILLNYALSQIQQCKQDRAKWQGVKDSFEVVR